MSAVYSRGLFASAVARNTAAGVLSDHGLIGVTGIRDLLSKPPAALQMQRQASKQTAMLYGEEWQAAGSVACSVSTREKQRQLVWRAQSAGKWTAAVQLDRKLQSLASSCLQDIRALKEFRAGGELHFTGEFPRLGVSGTEGKRYLLRSAAAAAIAKVAASEQPHKRVAVNLSDALCGLSGPAKDAADDAFGTACMGGINLVPRLRQLSPENESSGLWPLAHESGTTVVSGGLGGEEYSSVKNT